MTASITSIEEPLKGKNLLTIETSDSPGLLGRIAQVFKDNDVSIYSARINTLGDSVEDTFEIEDTTSSLVSSKKINKISRVLKETIKIEIKKIELKLSDENRGYRNSKQI